MSTKKALLLVLLLGVFVFASCSKQQPIPQDNQQSDGQDSQQNNENRNGVVNVKNDSGFGTLLTKEEIEKIKNSNYYVWYEIPETGIRFKVTPDTKDDFKYMQEASQEMDDILLYSKSVIEFKNGDCLEDGLVKKECTEGSLSRISGEENVKIKEKTGIAACRDSNIVADVEGDIICFVSSQSPVITTDSDYEAYLATVNDKNFGIYLNTIEAIQVDMSDWKAYQNEEYGIAFMYPQNLTPKSRGNYGNVRLDTTFKEKDLRNDAEYLTFSFKIFDYQDSEENLEMTNGNGEIIKIGINDNISALQEFYPGSVQDAPSETVSFIKGNLKYYFIFGFVGQVGLDDPRFIQDKEKVLSSIKFTN